MKLTVTVENGAIKDFYEKEVAKQFQTPRFKVLEKEPLPKRWL